jgi:predicted transcriptional regulator
MMLPNFKITFVKIALCFLTISPNLACQKSDDSSSSPPVRVDQKNTPPNQAQDRVQEYPGITDSRIRIVILSIYPLFIDWYEKGIKSYEFRKRFPTGPVSHIVYYNNGTKELMGVARVKRTLVGAPESVVELTWQHSGATREQLLEYYNGTSEAFATEVTYFSRLAEPLSLRELKDLGFSPSSRYQFAEDSPELFANLKRQIRTLEGLPQNEP